jgi:hypothetical protein
MSYGEGKLDLGFDFGQITATQIGNVTHNLNNDSTDFDLMVGLDFFFSDDAMKMFTDNIPGHRHSYTHTGFNPQHIPERPS